jgi:hypothetical protein
MGGCMTKPIGGCLSKPNIIEAHKINKPKIEIIFLSVVPTIKKTKKRIFKHNYKLYIKSFNKIPLRNIKLNKGRPPFRLM